MTAEEVIRTTLAQTVIGSLDREITREILAALDEHGYAIVPTDPERK
jgi:predicted CoA-binding protein